MIEEFIQYTRRSGKTARASISTEILDAGVIMQVVRHDDLVHMITSMFMDTQDQQIRQALIKLGWTPPKEEE